MNKIINKDILDGLKEIAPGSINLIFIDPPYNLKKQYADNIKDSWDNQKEYLSWIFQWLDIAIKKLTPHGSLYIMNTTQNMPYIDIHLQEYMHIKSRIIWFYDSSGVQAKKYFGSLYEPILFCTKCKDNYTFNNKDISIKTKTGAVRNLIDYRKNPPSLYSKTKVPGNVWYFPRVRYKMSEYIKHPSQKPQALLERIVKASSNKNDTVLDLFAGSFSLGVVCNKLKRNYIGIELSHTYCRNANTLLNQK
ncbi:adenine-specific DNA-methyltransferase [Pectinatus frisingensis]|uniref:adenine-specific DNA-methyltransferase n=1 Tax=Pectinatus frisingensis TaxID=865 RepID=UPI0018C46EB1